MNSKNFLLWVELSPALSLLMLLLVVLLLVVLLPLL